MGTSGCCGHSPLTSPLATVVFAWLALAQPVFSFFSPPSNGAVLTTRCLRTTSIFQQQSRRLRRSNSHLDRGRARRSEIAMERPSGKFNRLAKPKFDRNNPNAVLGEINVPGLEQVCMSAHAQLFAKREAVQLLKDRLQAWCLEENRREEAGVSLPGGTPAGDRAPRWWRAYEYIALPSRNRTLDSEVMGMNVGLVVNDTRLEVQVDFGNQSEAREVAGRLLDMTADVSKEANQVFGYADDAAAMGKQLGPWEKSGCVSSWRKWLELDSGKALPTSAVTVFRTVQANWAVPEKIAAAMELTTSWSTARLEESMADPETPLRRVEILHSALHPHVIKIVESFASADACLNFYHRHYAHYLEGVFDFRAAVSPTLQAYTPLNASLRPCLSTRLVSGVMIPLVAIGGPEDGVAPSPEVILEGFKIGLRHVVLEAGSSGVDEAVEALGGALAFGVLKREELFVTLVVGEDRAFLRGGEGIAGAVRETLASGRVDGGGGEGEDVDAEGRLLSFVDALVLDRGRFDDNDDNDTFLALWEEAREAAGSPASPTLRPSPPAAASTTAAPTATKNGHDSKLLQDLPPPSPTLARHMGLGGHGPVPIARLSLLLEESRARSQPSLSPSQKDDAEETFENTEGRRTVPGIVPAVFLGDLRAGDGAVTSESIELCRSAGVQVTGDEVLAKWVVELGAGVVWRPREADDVARTLPLSRYFLPPEWMTEIVERGGCPPEAWAQTLSRLLPPGGTPSEAELEAEADRTLDLLMAMQDEEEGGDEGIDN